MSQNTDIRTLFLEEFIKRIVVKSLIPKKIEKELLLERLDESAEMPPKLEIEIKKEPVLAPKETIKQPQSKKPAETEAPKQKLSAIFPIQLSNQNISPQNQLPKVPRVPVIERINRIFADPAVQSINCQGHNINILVSRLGAVQTTPISFTKEEIDDFMKNLSEKTRIPLLPGLFKVIFQNLIITAVISEFVGTKFIAERIISQQLPQSPAMAKFR